MTSETNQPQCQCHEQIAELRSQIDQLWRALIIDRLRDMNAELQREIEHTISAIDNKIGGGQQ